MKQKEKHFDVEQIDNELIRIAQMLEDAQPSSEQYSKLLEQQRKLYELKELGTGVHGGKEKREKRDRASDIAKTVAKYSVEVGLVAAELIVNVLIMYEGFSYEQTQVVSSQTFRNFLSGLKTSRLRYKNMKDI